MKMKTKKVKYIHKSALSLKENEELAEAVRAFPCLYDNTKEGHKDIFLSRMHGDQLGFIENSKFFFWVNFRPKV